MDLELNKINEKALTKIFFNGNQQEMFEQIDTTTNGLIFAGDGMFYLQNNEFGLIITRTGIPYRNLDLESLNIGQSYFMPKIRRPSLEWFQYIIECFQYVNGKTNNELLINLYYSKDNDKFVVDLPQAQVVSAASDKYKYSDIEYYSDYVRYAQIHSHNKMSPTPSATDNKDDQSVFCYQGIVGNLNQQTDVFSVSCSFRCWTGLKDYFMPIEKEVVFDYPEIQKDLVDQETTKLLDDILEKSKKYFNQNKKNNQNQNNYSNQNSQSNQLKKYDEKINERQNTILEDLFDNFLDEHFGDYDIENLDEFFKREE